VQRPPGNTGVPIPMFVTRALDIQLPFKGFDAGFPLQAERKNSVGWNLKIPPDPLLSCLIPREFRGDNTNFLVAAKYDLSYDKIRDSPHFILKLF
jgi:hypothetical protein